MAARRLRVPCWRSTIRMAENRDDRRTRRTSQAGTFCCTDVGGPDAVLVLHGNGDDLVRPVASGALAAWAGRTACRPCASVRPARRGAQCSAGLVRRKPVAGRGSGFGSTSRPSGSVGWPSAPAGANRRSPNPAWAVPGQGVAPVANSLPGRGRVIDTGDGSGNCQLCSGVGSRIANAGCCRDRR